MCYNSTLVRLMTKIWLCCDARFWHYLSKALRSSASTYVDSLSISLPTCLKHRLQTSTHSSINRDQLRPFSVNLHNHILLPINDLNTPFRSFLSIRHLQLRIGLSLADLLMNVHLIQQGCPVKKVRQVPARFV